MCPHFFSFTCYTQLVPAYQKNWYGHNIPFIQRHQKLVKRMQKFQFTYTYNASTTTTYHNAYPFLVNNHMLFTKSTIAPQFKKYLPKQVSNGCPKKTTSCTLTYNVSPTKTSNTNTYFPSLTATTNSKTKLNALHNPQHHLQILQLVLQHCTSN